MPDAFRWTGIEAIAPPTPSEAPALAATGRMVIDARFLSIHPDTALWHQQRSKCYRCANHRSLGAGKGDRCAAERRHIGGNGNGRTASVYCIDARGPSGACGPDARLYKKRG